MKGRFFDLEYSAKSRTGRLDRFLTKIEAVTPWISLRAPMELFYPKGVGGGRLHVGLETLLRRCIAQQWFGLSDKVIKRSLHHSQAIRRFVGRDLARENTPEATTLLKLTRLLGDNKPAAIIFETISQHLADKELTMRVATVVNATIIQAQSSTKNRELPRDPELHQTKKGNALQLWLKAHVEVDLKHVLSKYSAMLIDQSIRSVFPLQCSSFAGVLNGSHQG